MEFAIDLSGAEREYHVRQEKYSEDYPLGNLISFGEPRVV